MARRARKGEQKKGLTGIPQPIHCPATTDSEEVVSELDEIDVNSFVDRLAKVVMAVAGRRLAREKDGE